MTRHKRCRFNPWVGKIPWRTAWQPTPVFLPGESPRTEEPVGLQSIGSQRVRQNWSNLACMYTPVLNEKILLWLSAESKWFHQPTIKGSSWPQWFFYIDLDPTSLYDPWFSACPRNSIESISLSSSPVSSGVDEAVDFLETSSSIMQLIIKRIAKQGVWGVKA